MAREQRAIIDWIDNGPCVVKLDAYKKLPARLADPDPVIQTM
jgi:hypothetical protein